MAGQGEGERVWGRKEKEGSDSKPGEGNCFTEVACQSNDG